MGDDAKASVGSMSGGAADNVLEQVLRAEREAEDRVADARLCAERTIDAARTAAQAVERTTDRRLEAIRRSYGQQTDALAQDIAAHAIDETGTGTAPVDEEAARRAALRIARRLVGLPE
ncbi:hypothetical protein RGUI_2841 [Rhodovulum sp. P5]|uniref:hypothetical protein n=1 Tax=Rhodovulum sp. P5 TaxID=1564506 RepID=UPI0009C24663|nr:hypothetical protein [Rhodovulum sp. P5]ARE40982.1 hypothetical protein RGUI_2841 [Rhodovulum sp. P5]